MSNHEIDPKALELLKPLSEYSPITRQHCLEVGALAYKVVSGQFRSHHFRREIIFAAHVHDIGKEYVPKDTLESNEKISEEERQKVRTVHVAKGFDRINLSDLPGLDKEYVANLVRFHHSDTKSIRERLEQEHKDEEYIKNVIFGVYILQCADIMCALTSTVSHGYTHETPEDAKIKLENDMRKRHGVNGELTTKQYEIIQETKRLCTVNKQEALSDNSFSIAA